MGRRARGGPHGILVVDKPQGPTSHDVVGRVRKALATRRVGHCGTLDPMATGVLVVAVGEGTKLVPYLTADAKRYVATIQLGVATHSLDAQGEVSGTADVPALDQTRVSRAAESFLGTHPQQVPRVSAVRIDGRRAHALARDGVDFVPPTREATLHEVEARLTSPTTLDVTLHAAKGFYVRSFARDLAHALGTLGHLTRLRRTQSGEFDLSRAVEMASVTPESLLTLEAGVECAMPTVALDGDQAEDIAQGRSIAAPAEVDPAGPVALMCEGRLVAVARVEEGALRVSRGFPLAARTDTGGS